MGGILNLSHNAASPFTEPLIYAAKVLTPYKFCHNSMLRYELCQHQRPSLLVLLHRLQRQHILYCHLPFSFMLLSQVMDDTTSSSETN